MSEKVAVKSGYYFQIFDKEEIPSTLKNTDKKVYLDGEEYDLYSGTSLEDERKIDNMFGDQMGYSIDARLQNNKKPKCALIGEDGNIFNLMGITSKTLKRNGLEKQANEMINRITNGAKSYDQALMILSDYVDIVSKEDMEAEEYEEESQF